MIAKIALTLAVIYVPTMWIVALSCGVLGVAGVAAPSLMRSFVNVFTRANRAWLIGLVLLLIGAEIFVRAPGTSFPVLVRGLGTILFVGGGVVLFLPTLSVILAEWCAGWPAFWLRVLGLICLGLACLFYLGTKIQYVHVEDAARILFRGNS